MAEYRLRGPELVADISRASVAPGTLAFWWLGQNGFAFAGGARVYVDLYLREDPRRSTPPAFSPDEVTNADLVLATHDHSDHVDRTALPGILEASPRAVLVVSRVVADRLVSEGYPERRVVGLDDGEEAVIAGVSVTAIRSAHEFFDRDPRLGYPHVGFVVRMNGVTFYHAGDGVPWEGLVAAVAVRRPDIVFVPINGRDGERYRRNILGNFTFQEAVDFCGAVRPRLAVPMHYDMFPGNQEHVERFTDYLSAKYPHIPYWVGPPGERVIAGPW